MMLLCGQSGRKAAGSALCTVNEASGLRNVSLERMDRERGSKAGIGRGLSAVKGGSERRPWLLGTSSSSCRQCIRS